MDLQGRELGTVGQPGAYAGIVSDVADYWHRLLSLSPDGRTVAITRATGVDPPAVWLIDLERGISVPFTSGAWAAHPVWSPDGTELVYAQAKNTPPNLYIRNVTGVEGERHLMNSPHQMSPTDWPREPGGIIFNRHTTEQGWGLYWIPDLDQPKPRMLIDTEYDERTGRVSPDGKWITFVSDSSGASEIYVASFPEPRDMIRISSGGGASPRWSPSGREIFYIEPATGSLMRVGMSFTPTARATIASALFSVRENGFVFSPDGKLLLVNKIVSQPVSAPVTVLLNWKPR
jgi:Tol biopolymer transport system component